MVSVEYVSFYMGCVFRMLLTQGRSIRDDLNSVCTPAQTQIDEFLKVTHECQHFKQNNMMLQLTMSALSKAALIIIGSIWGIVVLLIS